MLKVPLINPSMEKILREFVSIAILVLIVLINSEKQIFLLNKFDPKALIASDTLEFKLRIISKRKKEKFIQIPHKINFIIKLKGVSDCV